MAKLSRPTGASSAERPARCGETLKAPSVPSSTVYSSLVPTTISGRASPVMSPTAGRVDDRALVELVAAVAEGDRVGRRVDRADLALVDDEDREAGDGAAVVVPGVDVAVHAGRDDLQLAAVVAVEVGEHRRAEEAVLGAVARARGGR